MNLSNIKTNYNINISQFFKTIDRKSIKPVDITEQQFFQKVRNQETEIYNNTVPLSDYTIESNLRTAIYNDNISLDSNNQVISIGFQYSLKDLSNSDFMSNFLVKENYYKVKKN